MSITSVRNTMSQNQTSFIARLVDAFVVHFFISLSLFRAFKQEPSCQASIKERPDETNQLCQSKLRERDIAHTWGIKHIGSDCKQDGENNPHESFRPLICVCDNPDSSTKLVVVCSALQCGQIISLSSPCCFLIYFCFPSKAQCLPSGSKANVYIVLPHERHLISCFIIFS